MISMDELLIDVRARGCSDLHLQANQQPKVRHLGQLQDLSLAIDLQQIYPMMLSMLDDAKKKLLEQGHDLDFTYVSTNGLRQRVNMYHQQGILCAAIRIIDQNIKSIDELQLPAFLKTLSMKKQGLAILTGPTGSGKSTTLAAMIEYINLQKSCHILTIEDPIEYVYEQKQAMIHQREVHADVDSFSSALRSAMREDPDIILVGEMRDYETIQAVITLAETGHLVFSTLHTNSTVQTIDRMIDVFPQYAQPQIRSQLSSVLQAVVSQRLLPDKEMKQRVPVFEIMNVTDGIRALIREDKTHQIASHIQTGGREGMVSMNVSLARLVKENYISLETAYDSCDKVEDLQQYL